jgi:hypothetical protein
MKPWTGRTAVWPERVFASGIAEFGRFRPAQRVLTDTSGSFERGSGVGEDVVLTLKIAYIGLVLLGTSFLFAVGLGMALGTAMAAYNWPAHESEHRAA